MTRFMHRHPDYERRIKIIRELWPDLTKSATDIAAIIGGDCNKNSVIGMARRAGLDGRAAPMNFLARSRASRKGWSMATPEQRADRVKNLRRGTPRGERPRVTATGWRNRSLPPKPLPVAAAAAAFICEPTAAPGTKQCHWPLWGDRERPAPGQHRYCGAPGYPWCEHHRAIVWRQAGGASAA